MGQKGRIFRYVFVFLISCCWVIFLVMVLWNALIPVLFKGPVLNIIQAAGLLILCRLLVGGFNCSRFGASRGNQNYPGDKGLQSFREKWARQCGIRPDSSSRTSGSQPGSSAAPTSQAIPGGTDHGDMHTNETFYRD